MEISQNCEKSENIVKFVCKLVKIVLKSLIFVWKMIQKRNYHFFNHKKKDDRFFLDDRLFLGNDDRLTDGGRGEKKTTDIF